MPGLADLVDELLATSRVAGSPTATPPRQQPAHDRVPTPAPEAAHGTRLRSAVTVGRDEVLAALRPVAAGDAGGHAAVVGEAGTGKTRIVGDLADAAAAAGLLVARGRGLAGGRGVLYRPLAELATSLVVNADLALDESLRPHRAALGELVPAWSDLSDVVDSRVPTFAAAEALAALCRATGRTVLLVVDDLQWSDPETIEVLATLARRPGTSYRLLLTARDGDADRTVVALEQDGVLVRWRLGPLGEEASRALCEAVVSARIPPALSQAVAARADGVPLVVEELMNDLVLRGGLRPAGPGRYELTDGDVFSLLPQSHRASIRARLQALDEPTLAVARTAALLGREVTTQRLRDLAPHAPHDLDHSLALLVERQVLEPVVSRDVDHRFVHALTREAVLAELRGPDLARLASALLDSTASDDLPASALERRADLALIAGRAQYAADLLRAAATQSRRHGALASAERQLRRVVGIRAADPGDAPADLVEVLALAGRTEAALEAGHSVLAAATAEPATRARLHLALARTHEQLSETTAGLDHLRQAEDLGAAAAPLALGRSRLYLAERRLEHGQAAALDALRAHRTAEEICEALELLARCARTHSETDAERLLEQMSGVAAQHGLGFWQLRATSELGVLDLFRLGDGQRLRSARDLAAARGDLVTATVVGYHEAIRRFHAVELDGWEAWLAAIQAEAAAYRLDDIEAATHLLGAAFLLLDGRTAEAHERMRNAADRPLDPDREASRWGIASTVDALLADDTATALDAVRRGVGAVNDREFGDPSPMWGTWALLATLAGEDGAPDDIERRGTTINQVNAGLAAWARALASGRAGMLDDAADHARRGVDLLARAPFYAAVAVRHALPLAQRQGWAQTWVGHVSITLDAPGASRLLAALTPAAPASDAARTADPTPDGLTAREGEVLEQVRRGASNAEIADTLVISVRTVEKHVERLLAKTGSRNRTQLATWRTRPPD